MYRVSDSSSFPLSDNRLPSRRIIHNVRVGSLFVCSESLYTAQLYIIFFIQTSFFSGLQDSKLKLGHLYNHLSISFSIQQTFCPPFTVALQKGCSNVAEEAQQNCKVMAKLQSSSAHINRLRWHCKFLAVPPKAAVYMMRP